jgi:hypothetical protein
LKNNNLKEQNKLWSLILGAIFNFVVLIFRKKKSKKVCSVLKEKNVKKSYRNTKSTNRNKKISNKSMFSTSKVKRRQKFVCGYPTEFAGSIHDPKKITRTPNLPIRSKIFPKKSMFRTLKKKRSRKFV